MADYIVPLGIDGKNLLDSLGQVITGLDDVADKATDTGKAMQTGMEKGAKAADTMEGKLKPMGKGLEELRDKSKKLNTDLLSAFDLKKEGTEFAKQVDVFKKKLTELTAENRVGLELDPSAVKDLREATDYMAANFSDISNLLEAAGGVLKGSIEDAKDNIATMEADIKDIESALGNMAPGQAKAETFKELGAAKQALEEETAALRENEAQLKETEAAKKDLAKTVKDGQKAVEDLTVSEKTLASSFDEVYGEVQPLTQRLGELEDRMYEMALSGQQNTQEFRDLQTEAIKYREIIQSVDNTVDVFARRSAVLDIAVEAAQGLTGAFAAAQGAAALFGDESEEVEKALLKVNAAMSLMQGVQAVAALFNRNSAVAALFHRTAVLSQTTAISANTTATRAQVVAMRTATVAARTFSVALKALGIGLVVSLIAYLVSNWDKLTEAVNKFLPAGRTVGEIFDSIQKYAVGVGNAVFQYLITPFTALTALLSGDLAGFKAAVVEGFSFKKNFTDAFNKQELANEKAHQRELESERIEADARELERRRNRGEDVEKEEIALQKRRLAILEENSKEYEEAQKELEDIEDAAIKRRTELQKEASEKRIEQIGKEAEQIAEYTQALEGMRIAAIKDQGEKELAEINETYRQRLEAIKNQEALTDEAKKLQIDMEVAAVEERERLIQDLEKRTARERITAQLETRSVLAQLAEESREAEIELLEVDHEQRMAAIIEQYEEEAEIRETLITALTESTARERKRIMDEWAERNLTEEEERQILAIELASEYAKKSEATERQKQIAIMETRIEFAEKYIESLMATGNEENSLEVLRARKALADLREGLQDEIKANKGSGFNMLEFLGMDLTSEDQQAVQQAGNAIGENLQDITDMIVDQYDRQIEKKQESIDITNDEIDELEDKLQDERDLREEGFANNVAVIEKEIAEKKEQRDKEIKDQQELLKKKESMQKAEMAMDTAVQLVNLITASTKIFAALAAIPFVGIPLAIATIATMFGAFTAAKIKAAQSISSGVKMGEGGWIDGKPHSQGGKKYFSESGEVRELEESEFVVKRKQAIKFSNLLEAINTGQFSGFDVNDNGLREMLAGMGVSMFEGSSMEALKEVKEIQAAKNFVTVNVKGNDHDLREINENIRFLAQKERERKESWEDEKYIYVKEGSRTTRIKKEINARSEEQL